jgi:hypothetical protein
VADGMRWTCFMKHRDPSPTSSQGYGYMWGSQFLHMFFFCWFQWIGNASADLMVAFGISELDRVRAASRRCSLSPGTVFEMPTSTAQYLIARPPLGTHTNFPSWLEGASRLHDQHMHRRPASTAHLLLVISFLCLGSEPVNRHGPNSKSITRGGPSSDTHCSLFAPRSMPNPAATAQLMQPFV